MTSFSSLVLLLTIVLVACCTSVLAQSRCVTTAYGPVAPSQPFSFYPDAGLASNLINLVPVTLNSTMEVAAIGVYPWSTQSSGTLNITCGVYINTSTPTGLVLLAQTPAPSTVIDFSGYVTPVSNTPMAVYLEPPVTAPAGQYVIACWWTWTGSASFRQSYTLGAPTTQAIAFFSTDSNSTLAFNTSNGQLPQVIAAHQQMTEIVSMSPGVMASLISTSYWCPSSSSSSSTGSNGASAVYTLPPSAVILLTVLALLALLN